MTLEVGGDDAKGRVSCDGKGEEECSMKNIKMRIKLSFSIFYGDARRKYGGGR